MSSAIRDIEKINQRQMEATKKRHQREINSIENAHSELKTDLKKSHNEEVVELRDENQRQITNSVVKKEKVLEEMKDNLNKTSQMTEKELKALKTQSEKEKMDIRNSSSQERERINAEQEIFLEDMNHRFNQKSQQVTRDGRNRVEEIKSALQEEYLDTTQLQKSKLDQKTQEFTTRFKNDDLNYTKLKDNQDNQFKRERLNTNNKQQIQLNKITKTHMEHVDKRDNEYRKGLKEQDLVFEKMYAEKIDEQNEKYKILEEKNNQLLESLKAGLTTEIVKTASRNDDPFYNFETLKPRLTSFEDRVEIKVEIPEHSNKDLQLTTNGKEAILSFNRRYQDASKTTDGTINKISKVETFTTRLPTDHILDAKSVKSSYSDGAMTYVIKKA